MRISDWSSDVFSSDLRCAKHCRPIVHISEGDAAGQLRAGHRNDERVRSGRQHQPVIAFNAAGPGREGLHLAVDRRDRITGDEENAVFLIPGVVVDDDVLERLLARQQRRTHDAVVIRSEEHTYELQSPLRISYYDVCLTTKN